VESARIHPSAASLPGGPAGDKGRPWPDAGPSPADIAREASSLRREKPVEVRLRLQRRAAANLRHHARRAATRFAVLVAADLVTFALVRAAFRLLKDGALPGQPFSDAIRSALPGGYLNGWEFAVALLLGLLITGSYGTGDRRRDAARLLAACALATALPLWTAVWTRGLAPVLVQYALTVLAMWVAILAERLTIDRLVAWLRRPAPAAMNTLFVGPATECARVAASPAFASDGEYRAGRPGLTLRAATAAALADELEKWERATPSRRRPALPPHGQAVLLPSEVAALFRVDRVTVTRWAAGRKLPSFRTPAGHRRFRASQVLPLLEFPPDGAAVSAAAGGRPWCAWCITGSSDDDCTCTSNCGESRCPR